MSANEQALTPVVPGLYLLSAPAAAAGSPSPDEAAWSYFLTEKDSSPHDSPAVLTLRDSWTDTSKTGWYLFMPQPIAEGQAEAFVMQARQQLPKLDHASINPRGLVWLTAPDPAAVLAHLLLYVTGQGSRRTLSGADPYPIGGLPIQWLLYSGVAVDLDPQAPSLLITATAASASLIALQLAGQQNNWYATYDGAWRVELALIGPDCGALQTTLALELRTLQQQLGCSIRYWVGGASPDQPTQIDAPLYPLPGPTAVWPGFQMRLHPLLPTVAMRSCLALDFGDGAALNTHQQASASLRSTAFLTPQGGALTLAPLHAAEAGGSASPAGLAAGFAFCAAPPGADSPLYLAPVGPHQVTALTDSAGAPAASEGQWMCGLAGTESLDVQVGDRLAFVTPMPALMPAAAGEAALVDGASTAWVQFPLSGGPRRYFAQPTASTYFSSVASGHCAQPLQALLATIDTAALVPLIPYGLCSGAPGACARLESGALVATRHSVLTANSPGPVFLPPAGSPGAFLLPAPAALAWGAEGVESPPTSPSHSPAMGATALTRQGYVVTLDAQGPQAGSWAELDIAHSPQVPGQRLVLTGAGPSPCVPGALASQLLCDQLFLVVSNGAALGSFANEISLAGFTFRLDVGSQGPVDASSTILIFKYNTSMSLRSLAAQPGLWPAQDLFVRDLEGTKKQLALSLAATDSPGRGLVAAASPTADDPFANFRAIADDPQWTGLIALNCAIDGSAMPDDLQMLLGGIDGQLRVHHFGVQGNRLEHGPGWARIVESSLFGVIAYPDAEQPAPPVDTTDDFAYELELLTVVFLNSSIQDFKAEVGLTINRLFGRDVSLVRTPASPRPSSPLNTLQIAGRYQLQDGIAQVTFSSDAPFFYEFPVPSGQARVLQQVAFNQATLAPLSAGAAGSPSHVSHVSHASQVSHLSPALLLPSAAGPSPGLRHVQARFSLAGALWFNPEPFASAPGLDLFSYGSTNLTDLTGGLPLNGLAVDISFTLDAQGGVVGRRQVTGNLSGLSLVTSTSALRPGSLIDGLPLQLTRFVTRAGGLTASSMGASPVNVLQLQATPPKPSPYSPALPSPWLTVSPNSTGLEPNSLQPPAPPPNITSAPEFGLEFDMPLGTLGLLSDATVGLMAKLVIGWGASSLVPDTDAVGVFVQLPQAFAGYGSFQLQGILKTVFGDANLLMVDLDDGSQAYAVLFNNVQLSVMGYSFPSGLVIDFLIFSGASASQSGAPGGDRNLAWFLGATGAGAASPAH